MSRYDIALGKKKKKPDKETLKLIQETYETATKGKKGEALKTAQNTFVVDLVTMFKAGEISQKIFDIGIELPLTHRPGVVSRHTALDDEFSALAAGSGVRLRPNRREALSEPSTPSCGSSRSRISDSGCGSTSRSRTSSRGC